MPLEISARDFGRVLRKRLEADADLARKAALEAAQRGVADVVEATNKKGVVDTGHYKRSWRAVPTDEGAELVNDTPYASVIEYGRRPGAPGPPVAPILDWVRRKLVPEGAVEPEDAERVAHAIRNAIHKHGTKPRYVLRDLVPKLGRNYAEAAVRILKRYEGRHRALR